jgi:AraC-like DNA-binding protein
MDFEFLAAFSPQVLDVVRRDDALWAHISHEIRRDKTRLNVLASVARGKGMFHLDDVHEPLTQGCVFQIAPGRCLHISSSARDPLSFVSVHFTYGLLRWNGGAATWREIPGRRRPLPFPIVLPDLDRPMLGEAFRVLLERWEAKESGYEWHTRIGFLEIVRQISGEMMSRSAAWDRAPARVRAAIEYMKGHLAERICRDDLARHVCLSPGYFSTVFHEFTGYGPMQYLAKLRVDAAKALLRDSALPVQSVAGAVGFPDPFYFARVFKKETGLSAIEYRRA